MWRSTYLLALVLAVTSSQLIAQVEDASRPGDKSQVVATRSVSPYVQRRERAMQRLPDGILLLHSRTDIKDYRESGFHQELNFFYFTGIENLTNAILAIDGQANESWLFVPTNVSGLPKLAGTSLSGSLSDFAVELESKGSFDTVADWNSFDRFIDGRYNATLYVPGLTGPLTPTMPAGMLAIADVDVLWYASLRSRWPDRKIESVASVVTSLRSVKDASEIAALRGAGAASVQGVLAGLGAIRPGVDQRSAEAAVISACLTAGGDGISFWPWLMSGSNSVFPKPYESFGDYRHLNRVMKDGELVRIDIGCESDHYQGDLGRTAPVSGKFTAGQREAWNLLIAGYRGGLAVMKDGVPWDDVVKASRDAVAAALADEVTSPKTELGRKAGAALLDSSIMEWHYHAIGLWASEPPPPVLRAGMVIDFEPMFAIDDEGYYLEDMILVSKDGYEILTPGLAYTADEIETAMTGQK